VLRTPEVVWVMRLTSAPEAIACSADGALLAVATRSDVSFFVVVPAKASLQPRLRGRVPLYCKPKGLDVTSLALGAGAASIQGVGAVVGAAGLTLLCTATDEGEETRASHHAGCPMGACRFSDDGSLLALAALDGRLYVRRRPLTSTWTSTSCELAWCAHCPCERVLSLDFSACGRWLGLAGWRGDAAVYDCATFGAAGGPVEADTNGATPLLAAAPASGAAPAAFGHAVKQAGGAQPPPWHDWRLSWLSPVRASDGAVPGPSLLAWCHAAGGSAVLCRANAGAREDHHLATESLSVAAAAAAAAAGATAAVPAAAAAAAGAGGAAIPPPLSATEAPSKPPSVGERIFDGRSPTSTVRYVVTLELAGCSAAESSRPLPKPRTLACGRAPLRGICAGRLRIHGREEAECVHVNGADDADDGSGIEAVVWLDEEGRLGCESLWPRLGMGAHSVLSGFNRLDDGARFIPTSVIPVCGAESADTVEILIPPTPRGAFDDCAPVLLLSRSAAATVGGPTPRSSPTHGEHPLRMRLPELSADSVRDRIALAACGRRGAQPLDRGAGRAGFNDGNDGGEGDGQVQIVLGSAHVAVISRAAVQFSKREEGATWCTHLLECTAACFVGAHTLLVASPGSGTVMGTAAAGGMLGRGIVESQRPDASTTLTLTALHLSTEPRPPGTGAAQPLVASSSWQLPSADAADDHDDAVAAFVGVLAGGAAVVRLLPHTSAASTGASDASDTSERQFVILIANKLDGDGGHRRRIGGVVAWLGSVSACGRPTLVSTAPLRVLCEPGVGAEGQGSGAFRLLDAGIPEPLEQQPPPHPHPHPPIVALLRGADGCRYTPGGV
jgi:hypothetical protein